METVLTNCPKCNGDSSFLFKTKDYNCKITNDFFSYRKCNECKLIFLSNIPNNLGDYYKEDYCSDLFSHKYFSLMTIAFFGRSQTWKRLTKN